MLCDLALCDDLFHTATGTAFADITIYDLAHLQQAISGLTAALLLPGDRRGRERGGDSLSA
jgi:hypothetical protein